MPELPDVEAFRRYFEATSIRKPINEVQVRQPKILDRVTPKDVVDALKGHSFIGSQRYGKHLLASIDSGRWLALHFGMTGYLKFFDRPEDEPEFVRLLIGFADGGYLAYDNRRMIGRVGLADSVGEFITSKGLGPDALAIDFETFKERVTSASGKIKQVLMDQALMAGIGNEYSDEILFQTRFHPDTRVKELDDGSIRNLYDSMRNVLDAAMEIGADKSRMPDWLFLPHRQRKGGCPRCGAMLKQLKVGGRTAYFCPTCQPENVERKQVAPRRRAGATKHAPK